MQKTKLGTNIGVTGAAVYLLSLFGGYVPMLLLAGYVLLFEENGWLKRTALKAVVLTFLFSIGSLAIGLLPDLISIVDSFANVFGGNIYIHQISSLCSALSQILSLVKIILMVGLAMQACKMRTIIIGFVDRLVNKCVE